MMVEEEVAVVKDLGLVSDLNSTEAGFDNCFDGAPFENFFIWVVFTEELDFRSQEGIRESRPCFFLEKNTQ